MGGETEMYLIPTMQSVGKLTRGDYIAVLSFCNPTRNELAAEQSA